MSHLIIGEHQRDLGFVGRVFQKLFDHLQARGDTRAPANHADVFLHVGGVGELGERACGWVESESV